MYTQYLVKYLESIESIEYQVTYRTAQYTEYSVAITGVQKWLEARGVGAMLQRTPRTTGLHHGWPAGEWAAVLAVAKWVTPEA